MLATASSIAVAAPAAPPVNANMIIRAGAAGAIAASTCGRGGAELHRRNARSAVRQELQARRLVPKDFDARYARAYANASARMKALTPSQRKSLCASMAEQGVRFKGTPPR